jgi:S1-C subfamily serine protease
MKTRLLIFVSFISFSLATGLVSRAQSTPQQDQAPVPQAPALSAPQGKVGRPPGAIDISQEPIVKIVANVQPAVVTITAKETVAGYYTAYNSYFRMFHPGGTSQSIGSGLIISPDGFVITNAHVVALAEKEKEVNITLSSGSKYRAEIITADDDADLALLKIEDKTQFPYFDLNYTSPNLLGETVVALGSPAAYENSVSHGILSALHRSFTVEDHVYNNLIQTDAAINPGNSGGPLIDLNGGLVGINSAKLAGQAIENIGFAIPNDVVIPWANDAVAVAKGLKPAPVSSEVSKLDMIHKHLGLAVRELSAPAYHPRRRRQPRGRCGSAQGHGDCADRQSADHGRQKPATGVAADAVRYQRAAAGNCDGVVRANQCPARWIGAADGAVNPADGRRTVILSLSKEQWQLQSTHEQGGHSRPGNSWRRTCFPGTPRPREKSF